MIIRRDLFHLPKSILFQALQKQIEVIIKEVDFCFKIYLDNKQIEVYKLLL